MKRKQGVKVYQCSFDYTAPITALLLFYYLITTKYLTVVDIYFIHDFLTILMGDNDYPIGSFVVLLLVTLTI